MDKMPKRYVSNLGRVLRRYPVHSAVGLLVAAGAGASVAGVSNFNTSLHGSSASFGYASVPPPTTAPTTTTSTSVPPPTTSTVPPTTTTVPAPPPTIHGLPPRPPISFAFGGAPTVINTSTVSALQGIIKITPLKPIVAGIESPGGGVFVVDSGGNVYAGHGANYLGGVVQVNPKLPPGGTNAVHLVAPIVNIVLFGTGARPGTVSGYYLVAADGGVFNFGKAPFYGSAAGHLGLKPVVAMAMTPDHKGYWEVASDGSVFGFGNAGLYGSMHGKVLAKPVVGMAPTPNAKGYWEVGSDGGVFAFGNARFFGSLPAKGIKATDIVGMEATPDGGGYWLFGRDGTVYTFGDAHPVSGTSGDKA